MILIRFFIILLISISPLNAQTINLNSMVVKEPKLKGVQFKEFPVMVGDTQEKINKEMSGYKILLMGLGLVCCL